MATIVHSGIPCEPFSTMRGSPVRFDGSLNVEAGGRVFTGSSVVERVFGLTSSYSLQPNQLRDRSIGEATLVDLGDGRVLLALLNGINEKIPSRDRTKTWYGGAEGVIAKRLGIDTQWHKDGSPGMAKLVQSTGTWRLTSEEMPILLTFRDVKDPKSFVIVDPNDVAATMGKDVRLTYVQLEITSDPVTVGIEQKLPWLPKTDYLTGLRYCEGPNHPCLDRGDIIRKR
jgi:hypothetical protein